MADTLTNFVFGDINLTTGIVWLLIAIIISMIGGAISGMIIAGGEIGYQLSAMLGGLLAPAGVIPAIILGLFILSFFGMQ
ncbi:MAG: hypothetical protein QNJ36_12010 [Calothrix sp. MO_167.B42]|nr:hypothetical protein [Calothrix sp. MO_167.B42]